MPETPSPVFNGNDDEQRIARQIFDLLMLQGRCYALDAPIRQSLRDLIDYFVRRGFSTDREIIARLIESAMAKNSSIFWREEKEGNVYYITSRQGRYVPRQEPVASRMPMRPLSPVAPPPTPVAPPPVVRPTIVKRELRPVPEVKTPRREIRQIRPTTVKRPPHVTTPTGAVINMTRPVADIFREHRDFFRGLLLERLQDDPRFVNFGDSWTLAEVLPPFSKGELRQVRDYLAGGNGPSLDTAILTELFEKKPDDADYHLVRFSLNYHLNREKKEFDFQGTASERLWNVSGAPAVAAVRPALRASEIAQDLRYLEDEPEQAVDEVGWIHTLTFFEVENGILPYTPAARQLLPPPFLKDQRSVRLQFRIAQLNRTLTAELFYPGGNRGGWIAGLEPLIAGFIPGARLIINRTESENVFVISYPVTEPRTYNIITYDEKRQRFAAETVVIEYEVDETAILDRNRFRALVGARRLEENNRRRSEMVVNFAFEKAGVKLSDGEEATFRASISQLLPVINIEKPFSVASLKRFFVTHPRYIPDETAEDTYLYTVERPRPAPRGGYQKWEEEAEEEY